MSIEMIAVKPLKYRTRMIVPGQHFRVKNAQEARVLAYLKKAERNDNPNVKVALDDARAVVGMPPLSKDSDNIKIWRDKYEAQFGKRPFNGWSIEQIKAKLA